MKSQETRIAFAVGGAFLVTVAAVLATSGCRSMPAESKGGSQLWAENCGRCHNIRSPSTYSDTEWQVILHHMRVRANLTAEEQKKILEFLKASN
jgi:hypothetical protein